MFLYNKKHERSQLLLPKGQAKSAKANLVGSHTSPDEKNQKVDARFWSLFGRFGIRKKIDCLEDLGLETIRCLIEDMQEDYAQQAGEDELRRSYQEI